MTGRTDTSGWKAFKIGDLFDVVKGTRLTKKDMIGGSYSFIGASAFNNGVTAKIGNGDHIHRGGLLTVTYNGDVGRTFYQPDSFWASDDVNVLYPKFDMDEHIALFIAPIIRAKGMSYSYNYKWQRDDMITDTILLPVTDSGAPDWEYMSSYMAGVTADAEHTLGVLLDVGCRSMPVDVSGWKDFVIGDLFEKLDLRCLKANFNKSTDCSETPSDEFSVPLVNARHYTNGVQYYGRPGEWETAPMTLDIVYNGAIAAGDVFVQARETGVLWDAYLIKAKGYEPDEYALLYMRTVIGRRIKQYFSYDNKCVWDKLRAISVSLPATDSGEPDWEHMSTYMRDITREAREAVDALS